MKINSFLQPVNPVRSALQDKSPGTDGNCMPGTEGDPSLDGAAFVVFDTELTGLNPKRDSIVSIGAVRMQGKRILLGETFYRLVEPRTPLTAQSVVIHEITPAETKGSPGLDALLPEFLDFCKDAIVVGHAVSIDLAFLNREMKQLYGNVLRNTALDTSRLYQWIRRREEDACAFHGGLSEPCDLFSLARKYQIPVEHAHHALCDAFVTAQLLQRFLCELPRWGITKRGQLPAIASP
jgi:DNA polymerase-3 subunit epsilon